MAYDTARRVLCAWLLAGCTSHGLVPETLAEIGEHGAVLKNEGQPRLDAFMPTVQSGDVAQRELRPPTSPGAAPDAGDFGQPSVMLQPRVPKDAASGEGSGPEATKFEDLRGNHEGMVLYSEGRTATGATRAE
eukprot:scaffold3081_cov242-Prasinococcus_capsulatus_cf.AAC.3